MQKRQVRLSVLLRYRLLSVMERLFISAWALTLSVHLDWAMQEPWYVERTTVVSTLFLCPFDNNRLNGLSGKMLGVGNQI